jgi:hypothetical protein
VGKCPWLLKLLMVITSREAWGLQSTDARKESTLRGLK